MLQQVGDDRKQQEEQHQEQDQEQRHRPHVGADGVPLGSVREPRLEGAPFSGAWGRY